MIICTFPLDIQSPQNSGSSSALFAHHILETSHFEDLPQQWLWHCQNVLLRKTPLGMIFHGMKRRSHSSSWSCGRKTMSYGFWMSYYYDGAMILCSKPLQTSPYNKVEIIYKQSSQTSFHCKQVTNYVLPSKKNAWQGASFIDDYSLQYEKIILLELFILLSILFSRYS